AGRFTRRRCGRPRSDSCRRARAGQPEESHRPAQHRRRSRRCRPRHRAADPLKVVSFRVPRRRRSMLALKRLIDFFTLGSDRPMRRLIAYYVVVAVLTAGLLYFAPVSDRLLFSGERLEEMAKGPQLLQEAPAGHEFQLPDIGLPPRLELVITTGLILVGT